MARTQRILSLDGGGIRGLISALWLQRLEQELGKPLREVFDLIAGTSTGGILACGVAAGVPTDRMVELYRRRGQEIFPSAPSRLWSRVHRTLSQGGSAPKYDGVGLEKVLKSELGELRLRDIPKHTTLLVTTYDTLNREPLVIKSSADGSDEIFLWEIAKATCSAPTYFPAHLLERGGVTVPLIDGGVYASNPSLCAIAEAIRLNAAGDRLDLDQVVVASFGTGENTRSISVSEAREWGALEWAVPLIDVLLDGSADMTHKAAQCLLRQEHYVRFQVRLEDAYDDLDRADLTNLNALSALALHYLEHEGATQLARLVELLQGPTRSRDPSLHAVENVVTVS
jgi:uncharacterized protein